MWVKNASDGEGYEQAMLGVVTSTGLATLQVVAATEKQCWVWSYVIPEEEF
jgi:hypothetical protein